MLKNDKVKEPNSRTEATFLFFNSNIIHFLESSNMAYNMFLVSFKWIFISTCYCAIKLLIVE